MVRLESLAKNVLKLNIAPGEPIHICTYHAHAGIIIRDYQKCEARECRHYQIYTIERRTEK